MRIRLRYLATFLMVSWVVVTLLYLIPLILSYTREEKVVSCSLVHDWAHMLHDASMLVAILSRGLEVIFVPVVMHQLQN